MRCASSMRRASSSARASRACFSSAWRCAPRRDASPRPPWRDARLLRASASSAWRRSSALRFSSTSRARRAASARLRASSARRPRSACAAPRLPAARRRRLGARLLLLRGRDAPFALARPAAALGFSLGPRRAFSSLAPRYGPSRARCDACFLLGLERAFSSSAASRLLACSAATRAFSLLLRDACFLALGLGAGLLLERALVGGAARLGLGAGLAPACRPRRRPAARRPARGGGFARAAARSSARLLDLGLLGCLLGGLLWLLGFLLGTRPSAARLRRARHPRRRARISRPARGRRLSSAADGPGARAGLQARRKRTRGSGKRHRCNTHSCPSQSNRLESQSAPAEVTAKARPDWANKAKAG